MSKIKMHGIKVSKFGNVAQRHSVLPCIPYCSTKHLWKFSKAAGLDVDNSLIMGCFLKHCQS